MKAIMDGLSTPDIFRDQSKLDFDYIPEELLYRDEEGRTLVNLLRPMLKDKLSQNILITGPVGTGKTALVKRFSIDIMEVTAERNIMLECIHVNCRRRRSESMVMSKIINHFQPNFPDRGFTVNEMQRILMKDIKKRAGCKVLVILDEVDSLIRHSGCDLLYSLSRFNEEEPYLKGSISLILISQNPIYDILDEATLSTIKRTNRIDMKKYNKEQLWGIIEKRASLAFLDDVVEYSVYELIADIASEWGDARYAIELLETAGMMAQQKGERHINAEHIRAARASTSQGIDGGKLSTLTTHQKITLLAVARGLVKDTYISTGDVETFYNLVCEEYGEKPRKYTQFWKYIQALIGEGLIGARKVTKGIHGMTRHITISEMPITMLISELEGILARELNGKK